MTTVINMPPSLDDRTFESVLQQLAPLPPDEKVLLDTRHTRWASPYGLTALLVLAQTRAERPALYAPEAEETASYWARAQFFRYAEGLFEMHGSVPRARGAGESDVLLEITPVSKSEDVHEVVGRIQSKAQAILAKELNLDPRATMGFAMTLSEACQNIVEHAGRGGWVAVQTYRWQKRLGRRVVQIAVCDGGIGFRASLESAQGRRGDRWDDAMALEDAVIRSVSRFRDAGRGQGLAGIRRYVGRWDGKLSIRSGTARIAIVPSWDEDVPLEEQLPPFPGAQVLITIPERTAAR
ncbi:MAG TPA: ATP-binding protein [Gemmatimonadaceae bacterium]|jgi:anti-sigma regulatory factor (Ser/Thr protein kinase)|nr:ATP-binding protein [Gemmatimonadaceae bacterium]